MVQTKSTRTAPAGGRLILRLRKICPAIRRVTFSALLCSLLAGCATMSGDECRRADWYDIGRTDGAAGRSASYAQNRAAACAEAGVAIDARRYEQGRSAGLQQYCRPENAFALGASGGTYSGACAPALDAELRRRYSAGRAIHDANKEVKRLQDSVAKKERQLQDTIKEEEKRLRNQNRDEDRRRIRREFSQLRDRMRIEIETLDRELRRARDRLHDAERAGRYLR